MFETILTLRESEDEIMHRDADNIVSMLGGNLAELMGDRMGDVIQEFIDNASLRTIRKSFIFNNFICILTQDHVLCAFG